MGPQAHVLAHLIHFFFYLSRHDIFSHSLFIFRGKIKKFSFRHDLYDRQSLVFYYAYGNLSAGDILLDRLIIEEYIPGREITIGIIEDKALPIVEIVPKRKFFDFTAKYEKGMTEYIVPAQIEEKMYKMCQDVGLRAHKVLSARSFSRVDIILNEKTGPVVLEINTLPGFTETSLLPKAAKSVGISFEDLCLKILNSALLE